MKLTTSARAPLLAPENLERVPPSRQAVWWRRGAGDRARVDVSWSANQPAPDSRDARSDCRAPPWLRQCPALEVKGTLPPRRPTSAPAPSRSPRASLPSPSGPCPPSRSLPPRPLLPSSSPAGGGQVRAGPRRGAHSPRSGPVAAAAPSRRSDRARLWWPERLARRGGRRLGARSSEQGRGGAGAACI